MRIARITSLQWVIGGFLSVLGALILVAPHQFSAPDYPALQQDKIAWGLIFMVIGAGILASTVFKIHRMAVLAIHLVGGLILLMLSRGFLASQFWLWMVNYELLGLAVIVMGLVHYRTIGQSAHQRARLRVDIFAIFVGLNQGLTGFLFLLFPANFTQPRFDLIRPYFALAGSIYLVSAFVLIFSQFLRRGSWDRRLPYLAAGLVYLAFLALVPVPNQIWQGILYYGIFGLALIFLPWINTQLNQFNPYQLRTRLAVLLAGTMALPLILTVALVSQQLESSRQQDVMDNVENYARLISQDVGEMIYLHQAGLKQLAASPDLLTLDRAVLKGRLQGFAADYPNVIGVAIYTADGQPVTRNDDAPQISINGYPVFEKARQTGAPSMDTLISPVYNRPVISLGMPLMAAGRFQGLAVVALDSAYFAQSLQRVPPSSKMEAYLVNERGQAIVHPDPALAPLADFSASPPVRAYFENSPASGQMAYEAGNEGYLAGYASIPSLGWAVFVEQPTEVALASVYSGRNLAFGILLIFLGLTSMAGIFLASWMSGPLLALQNAVRELSWGSNTVPLPSSRITEIQNLADVFGEMRRNLAARTAEREQAEEALRRANEALEARVQERTADLQRANQQLVFELSERRKAEEFLRRRTAEAEEGRRILQALMQHIPAGIAISDGPTGEPRMISRFGRELLGMDTDEEVVHVDNWVFYYPDGVTRAAEDELPLVRAIRNGEVIQNEEWVVRRANGDKATILCNAGPVQEPGGTTIGGVMSWIDITESKRASEAVASYARALARSNKDLQDFAYIASHDLQEPLRKIQAFGEKVFTGYQEQLDHAGRDYLKRMQSAARRMQVMIDDLLEYSRVTTRTQPMQPISLNEIMEEVISNLELRIEQSGGQLEVDHLPIVYGDRSQMVQLLQNLVSNALKFHRPDLSPVVRVYARRGTTLEDSAEITVEDNGIGFNEQYLDRILQPFQRLHGRNEFEGSGIGLAICRKIVERHNGQITARSTPGEGTRFIVILPLRQPENQGEMV